MKFIALTLLLLTSLQTLAATPISAVEQVDRDREGSLAQWASLFFNQTVEFKCDDPAGAKIQVTKLSSYSSNDEKVPGTPYHYSANYLVTGKCLSGSTFFGAGIDVTKAVLIAASFKGIYMKGSLKPADMREIKIRALKEVSDVIVDPNL